jgi:hypothetical protein
MENRQDGQEWAGGAETGGQFAELTDLLHEYNGSGVDSYRGGE